MRMSVLIFYFKGIAHAHEHRGLEGLKIQHYLDTIR